MLCQVAWGIIIKNLMHKYSFIVSGQVAWGIIIKNLMHKYSFIVSEQAVVVGLKFQVHSVFAL